MTKQGKLYSKREKTAAIMVSTLLIGAPVLLDGSHVAFAEKPATSIDKIGNLIVPLDGTIMTRNLMSIYDATESPNFKVTSVNSDGSTTNLIANNEPGFSSVGLLKIHPNRVGTATFTVTYNLGVDAYQDTFDVTVVNGSTTSIERNFDIGDVAQAASSRTEAETLLSGIGPMNSTGIMAGNHLPTLNANNPFHNYIVEMNTFTLLNTHDLRSYFSDADINENEDEFLITEVFENKDSGSETSEDSPIASIYHTSFDGWVIEGIKVGVTTFTVATKDAHGGVVTKSFEVEVRNHAPNLNNSNPVVAHIAATTNNTLNISANAALDLDEIFFDFSPRWYEMEVNYNYGCGNVNVSKTVTIPHGNHLLSYGDLISQLVTTGQPPNGASIIQVTKLVAIDSMQSDLKTELNNVNINLSSSNYNNIPTNVNIYASNTAGAGTFTIDPEKHWLDENKKLVDVQPEQPSIPNVTSSFNKTQPNQPITFTAGLGFTNSIKKFHLFSKTTQNEWYLNDLTANVVSTNVNPINLVSLYATNSGINWSNINDHLYDYASISPTNSVSEDVYYYYTTGNSTFLNIELENALTESNGTILFTFDPDANTTNQGSRVYTIPYVRYNGPL